MAVQQTFSFLTPPAGSATDAVAATQGSTWPTQVNPEQASSDQASSEQASSDQASSDQASSEQASSDQVTSGQPPQQEPLPGGRRVQPAGPAKPVAKSAPPKPNTSFFPATRSQTPATRSQMRSARARRILQQLNGHTGGRIAAASSYDASRDVFSTGCQTIDQWFPGGGLPNHTISEWVADHDACGASALSLAVVAAHMRQSGQNTNQAERARQTTRKNANTGGRLVIVANENHFYPPAAIAVGIDPAQMIWVRPSTTEDTVWAIDQSLRCTGVSAVWAPVGAWLKTTDARRFQLAAQAGQTTGFLVRPASVRGRPTFAQVRFHVALAGPLRPPEKQHGGQQHSGQQHGEPRHTDSPMPTWTLTLDRSRGAASSFLTGDSPGAGSARWVDTRGSRQTRVTMNHQGDLRSLPLSAVASNETAAMRLASQLADPKTTSPAITGQPRRSNRPEPATRRRA